MKKLTLVLALLVSFGLVGAFAQTVAPVVDFSAEAEAVFGIDLNEEVSTGFTNSAEADLSITWIDETVENEGEGTYGWIQIEELIIAAEIDEESDDDESLTGSVGDINARVYFSPAYLQVSTAPGFGYNNADALRIQAADDNDPVDSLGSNDLVDSTGGIILGMEGLAGMVDLAFKVGSVDTYEKSTADATLPVVGYYVEKDGATTGTLDPTGYATIGDFNDAVTALENTAVFGTWIQEPYYGSAATSGGNVDHEYVFGIDATIMPMEMLSIGLGVVFSNVTDAGIGFTLNPVFTMGMLEAGLPVDVFYGQDMSTDDEVYFELAPYVTYDLNEAGSNVGFWSFISGSTYEPPVETAMTVDLKVAFEEVADGFVPGLETSLAFYAFDVLTAYEEYAIFGNPDAIALGLTFNASYAVGDVKPFVDVKWASKEGTLLDDTLDAAMLMDDDTTFDSDTDVLTLEAGVDLTMVSNTTFTMKYASDNLMDDTLDHSTTGTTGIDKGRITFSATVAY